MTQRPLLTQLLTLLLAAMLAGCVATPPVATPQASDVRIPDSFAYTPDAATRASVDALLPKDDPAFVQLAKSAANSAPNLQEAAARVEAARAGARKAGAARQPNVSLDRSISASRTNPDQFGSNLPAGIEFDTERVSVGSNVVASWDADLFGALKASERAAIARVDVAEASGAAVRIALTSEIAASVIDWRVLQMREVSLRDDLLGAQRLAQLAGARERAGLAPGFDRLRAEAAASASQTRLEVLESERARIVGRLVALTGEPGQYVLAALAQPPLTSMDAVSPVALLPSQMLENRPDVLAAAAQLTASDAQLAATARKRFPRLTLSAALGLLSFDLDGLFDEDAIVGSATGSLLAPLLDFGRIQAEIDGAAAEQRIAFAQYRGAVFAALGDAETAYGLIAATDRQSSSAKTEEALLRRNANLANTRYKAGLADFLTVLEARRAADSSGERAAIAQGQALRARVLLWQALGGDAPVRPTDQSANSSQ